MCRHQAMEHPEAFIAMHAHSPYARDRLLRHLQPNEVRRSASLHLAYIRLHRKLYAIRLYAVERRAG